MYLPDYLGVVAFKEIILLFIIFFMAVVNQVDGLELTHHINTCYVLTVVYSAHVA